MKANDGPTGGEILLTWRDGVFVADASPSGLDRRVAGQRAERVFLKLLRLHAGQGRHVSATPSVTFAPTVFAKHPEAEGITKGAFRQAMETLLTAGRTAVGEHGRGRKARSHLVEVAPQ